jgi:ABC-2 type transport system ATP-binding protein
MITVENLSKSVKKKKIVDGVSFSVGMGKVFALLGPNGAGKSTTIKMLLGFVRPDSGKISIESSTLGYLPENPYYYDHLSLKELLEFSLATFGIKGAEAKRRIEEIAAKVGMAESLGKRLRTFSKGMLQRAGIAAAIIHSPELIVLDEPMSGLDPIGRRMVFDLILELKEKGATVLICSHILSDVERLCDEAVIMNKGKVAKTLSKEELLLASKNSEIIYEKSAGLEEAAKAEGLTFAAYDKTIGISAESSSVAGVIISMSAKGFDPVSVKSSESALEHIFIETVQGGR